ncbi:MAG: hypothetical protein ABW022_25900 [Actinoplanes sp.]
MTIPRRHAVTMLLSLLTLVPLAACAPVHDPTAIKDPPPTTAPAPAVPARAPAPAPPPAPKIKAQGAPTKHKHKPAPKSTARDPLWGRQYAFFKSADLNNRRITFDLVEWYDGKAAVKACKADGEKPAENDWCTGYYIRNKNRKLRTLTVYPDAPLRTELGGVDPKNVDLKGFVAALRTGNPLFSFDVDANRVMAARQVYLP